MVNMGPIDAYIFSPRAQPLAGEESLSMFRGEINAGCLRLMRCNIGVQAIEDCSIERTDLARSKWIMKC